MKEAADPKHRAELEQDITELDNLLDEILLASRLEAPFGLGDNEEIDFLALIAEECARYDHVELTGISARFKGQPRLLRRLVRNLLENAKRHGEPPININLRIENSQLTITVFDQGQGVALVDRGRVFEPFFRSKHSIHSTGAGLGLALVQQIAKYHGGEARCEENEHGKSQFIVRLPYSE
jgi:signal transduction histidine kinase